MAMLPELPVWFAIKEVPVPFVCAKSEADVLAGFSTVKKPALPVPCVTQYKDALKDFSKSLNLNQKFVQAYIGRGNVFMKMKHYKKALEDFTLAIEIKPDFSIAYLNRGIAFRSDGKIEEAVIDFNKFLNLQNGKDSNTSQVRNWIKKLGYEPEH